MRPAQDIVATLGLEPVLDKDEARRASNNIGAAPTDGTTDPALPSDCITLPSERFSERSPIRSPLSLPPPPVTVEGADAVEGGNGGEENRPRLGFSSSSMASPLSSEGVKLGAAPRPAAAGFSNRCARRGAGYSWLRPPKITRKLALCSLLHSRDHLGK